MMIFQNVNLIHKEFNSEDYIFLSNLVLRIILIMGMEHIIQLYDGRMEGKHMVNTKHHFSINLQ